MVKKVYVFDRLLVQAARNGVVLQNTKQATDWFHRRAGKVKDSTNRMFSDAQKSRRYQEIMPGDMVFFKYDAKGKATLPWWDAVPLIIPFGIDDTHFIGISLHHAPPKIRAKLLDMLMSIASDKRLDNKTKMNLTYSFIKKASKNKYFKPLIRKYLKSHVQSDFIKIHPVEWSIAIFLPLQSFRKMSAAKVYSEYRKAIK